ncbi:hypothetical protein VYU27_002541 [Nannochloropsis oceanica]
MAGASSSPPSTTLPASKSSLNNDKCSRVNSGGAAFSVRLQAKDILAELERSAGKSGGFGTSGRGREADHQSLSASSSSTNLFLQLSSSSSSSLGGEEGVSPLLDFDDDDPMSPQSVFPRVRQRLREEAADHSSDTVSSDSKCNNSSSSGSNGSSSRKSHSRSNRSSNGCTLTDFPLLVTGQQGKKRLMCGRQLPEITSSSLSSSCSSSSCSSSSSSSSHHMAATCGDDRSAPNIRTRTPPPILQQMQGCHNNSSSCSSTRESPFNGHQHDDLSQTSSLLHLKGLSMKQQQHQQDDTASVCSSSSLSSTCTRPVSCPPPSLPAFHKTAPASVGGSSSSSSSNNNNNSSTFVITPLPRAALKKSSLYELQAALEELKKALADMETTAYKRARVRSEAYIIKFEREFSDLVRIKDRAIKRLDALLHGRQQQQQQRQPQEQPKPQEQEEQEQHQKGALAPDSNHGQMVARVLMVVMDLDDELLMLMGEEHGTWEELMRLREDIQRHLDEVAIELGGCMGGRKDKKGRGENGGGAEKDSFAPCLIMRSLSTPHGVGLGALRGGRRDVGSTFSVSVAASRLCEKKQLQHHHHVGNSNSSFKSNHLNGSSSMRKQRREDITSRLRPLEISLPVSPPTSASSASRTGAATGKKDGSCPCTDESESPSGTVTTASFSSSSSSAFCSASDQGFSLQSDEEEKSTTDSSGNNKSSGSCSSVPPRPSLVKAVSSDGLSTLFHHNKHNHRQDCHQKQQQQQQELPLPVALTKNVEERAAFIHHRTLSSRPFVEASLLPGGAPRASYHRRISRPLAGTAGREGSKEGNVLENVKVTPLVPLESN